MQEKETSKQMMKRLVHEHYEDALKAKERGEKVGWSITIFPNEITESFGLNYVFPENHSVAVTAKHLSNDYLEYADKLGYNMDTCSYVRINLGYLESRMKLEGVDVPDPDFLLVCNNICDQVIKWFEILGRDLNIPVIFLDTPFNNEYRPTDSRMEYGNAQFEVIKKQLEEITGKKFNQERFDEVVRISGENGRLWNQVLDMMGHDPNPLNGFDSYNYMALLVTQKCKKTTTECLKLLIKEMEERMKNRTTAFRGEEEKYQIFADGINNWCHMRNTSDITKSLGVNITGSTVPPCFGKPFADYEGMMYGAIDMINNNQSIQRAVDERLRIIRTNRCQGSLVHMSRSCKPWIGCMYEVNRQVAEKAGIPVAYYDGDQADPRVYSPAQFETRLQGLTEVMEQRKQGGIDA